MGSDNLRNLKFHHVADLLEIIVRRHGPPFVIGSRSSDRNRRRNAWTSVIPRPTGVRGRHLPKRALKFKSSKATARIYDRLTAPGLSARRADKIRGDGPLYHLEASKKPDFYLIHDERKHDGGGSAEERNRDNQAESPLRVMELGLLELCPQ